MNYNYAKLAELVKWITDNAEAISMEKKKEIEAFEHAGKVVDENGLSDQTHILSAPTPLQDELRRKLMELDELSQRTGFKQGVETVNMLYASKEDMVTKYVLSHYEELKEKAKPNMFLSIGDILDDMWDKHGEFLETICGAERADLVDPYDYVVGWSFNNPPAEINFGRIATPGLLAFNLEEK